MESRMLSSLLQAGVLLLLATPSARAVGGYGGHSYQTYDPRVVTGYGHHGYGHGGSGGFGGFGRKGSSSPSYGSNALATSYSKPVGYSYNQAGAGGHGFYDTQATAGGYGAAAAHPSYAAGLSRGLYTNSLAAARPAAAYSYTSGGLSPSYSAALASGYSVPSASSAALASGFSVPSAAAYQAAPSYSAVTSAPSYGAVGSYTGSGGLSGYGKSLQYSGKSAAPASAGQKSFGGFGGYGGGYSYDPCSKLPEGDYVLEGHFQALFPYADPQCNFIKCSNYKAYVNPCAIGTKNDGYGKGFCYYHDKGHYCGYPAPKHY